MCRSDVLRRAAMVGWVALATWPTVGCLERGDVVVQALTFDGNEAVPDDRLRALLVTKATGGLPFAPKQYFNRTEFEADLGRLRRFYQDRGFPNARITGVEVALNDARDAVRLAITLDEGDAIVVEAVRFDGFDVLETGDGAVLAGLPIQPGAPRDLDHVGASRLQLLERLRDLGYAYATVNATEQPGTSPNRVVVIFGGVAGPLARFGPITIEGLTRVEDRVVLRELTFTPGQTYQPRRLTQSQRRLSAIELLQFVNVDARPPEGTRVIDIPVRITVAENPPRRLQLGVGYGSESGVRGSAAWSHLNFMGNARHLLSTVKWSSIERGMSLDFTQPYLYRPGLSLELGGSGWWTTEDTYNAKKYGGRAGIRYRLTGRGRGGRGLGDVLRAGYVHEYLRYNISATALADLAGLDELVALGLDPTTGQGRGTKAALNAGYERVATDSALNPRRGYALSAYVEHARPWLTGTFAYDEFLVEGRGYLPLGSRADVAARARMGTLAAATDADVPFSERYFLGGSTSLRGWGRYEVAPLANGLPVGGRSMLDASLELRMQTTRSLGVVLFMDTGNVWPGGWDVRPSDLRHAVGPGLRYTTRVGLIRADLGYQLNPVPELRIDGAPQKRRWRLHFSIGQAF